MSEFCHECTKVMLGKDPDKNEFNGIVDEGDFANVFCHGCNKNILVDHEGKELKRHPYFCPLDGIQLYEIGLGLLECVWCHQQFVPTSSDEGFKSIVWEEK